MVALFSLVHARQPPSAFVTSSPRPAVLVFGGEKEKSVFCLACVKNNGPQSRRADDLAAILVLACGKIRG